MPDAASDSTPGLAWGSGLWAKPAAPVVLIAAVQLALHLGLNGKYGFHTDELYYIASGQHPALGYVDFPPITPLLARLNIAIFGISPWTLRLFPAITGAGGVLVTGLCALELGATRRVAALAAVIALLSPYLLVTWLFQTVEFDQIIWLVAIYLMLRITRTSDPRLFLPLGLALGIGIETKTTIVGLWLAIAAVVLAAPSLRRLLRTAYPWVGLVIAVGCAVPNAIWQVANGFPTLTYIRNHGADIAQSGGIGSFVALFGLLVGPLVLPLWIAGLVLLLRDPRFRPMFWVVIIAIVAFLPDGKAYYPGPTVPFVLAAGCVAVSRLASPAGRRWAAGLAVAASVIESIVLSPIGLPLIPPQSMHAMGIDRVNPDFANTVGWPEMTAQVATVYDHLPPEQKASAAIMAAIDGQAAAINLYGASYRLPEAISPHLSFWYWKPPGLDPSTIVTVGYAPSDLSFLCGSVVQATTVTIPYSIDNLSQGSPILICTSLRESLAAAWPALRNFS